MKSSEKGNANKAGRKCTVIVKLNTRLTGISAVLAILWLNKIYFKKKSH